MTSFIEEDDYLAHYGILRRSGRYPWGSGGNIPQRSRDFLDYVENMRRQGLSETEIAKGVGLVSGDERFSTTDLRAAKAIAKAQKKAADISMAERLKERGWANTKIAERMGINESSVRALLAPGAKDKADLLQATANMLKDQVAENKFVDIGSGVENHVGVSATRLNTAVSMLKAEGYEVHNVQVPQIGTNQKTLIKVLAPPNTTYRDIVSNVGDIKSITDFSDDGGRSFLGVMPPLSVSSKRVAINYAEDGGDKMDGLIYLRPGVDDISLGSARYAQVRIAVDGTHYLKGMAVHKADLPDGVDIVFNTNKSSTGNKLDAMKPMKDEPDNPFGATIRQRIEMDSSGNPKVTSALNIVGGKDGLGEEGAWDSWSKNLPTQFLSKQSPVFAKEQLAKTYAQKKEEFEEISALTNPVVKKQLLESFADSTDASAVHMKAAAMPRQSTHVLMPINSLKDTEVYAPNFKDGERLVLVRFPHGGTFEIPELTVNNKNREGKSLLGSAKDAIGINSNVASRLSGADFDGDTVLAIPNNSNKIKTSSPLEGLKNFDPQSAYPAYEGMKQMTSREKGMQMGLVSNLITDMSIQKASSDELARAVRHSMVVIDAEKHNLNYKLSAEVNGIPQLMEKYQGKKTGGAATLISRATGEGSVPERRLFKASEGGPVDPKTGKLRYKETGEYYIDAKGKRVDKVTRGDRLSLTDDAHTLSSGTVIEKIYADHSNKLKDLANQARLEAVNTKRPAYSPSAKKAFADEVVSLNDKLNLVQRNRPLERQAQVIANQVVAAKRASNPSLDAEGIKKIKFQALAEARRRTGAKRHEIYLTDNEWKAIQAGAISANKLEQILRKSDLTRVRQLATPRTSLLMTSAKTSRAKSLLNSGLTQSEVADILGVSLTTLKNSL